MNKAEIYKLIIKLGIPAGHDGFKYIMEAAISADTSKSNNMGDIFSTVGEKYLNRKNNSASRNNVEKMVQRAIEYAYDRKPELFKEMFGYDKRPSNKQFICAIVNYFRYGVENTTSSIS